MRKIITKTNPKSYEEKTHTIFANIPMRKPIIADGLFLLSKNVTIRPAPKTAKTKFRREIPPYHEHNGA